MFNLRVTKKYKKLLTKVLGSVSILHIPLGSNGLDRDGRRFG